MKKYKVGALAGKFLPPQVGHAKLIKVAAEQSDILYVALAENPDITAELCRAAGLAPIRAELRLEWLKEHFKDYNNIVWLYMDERGIPPYPSGTKDWSARFKELIYNDINKKNLMGAGIIPAINAKFFGEEAYFEMNKLYFPESAAVLVKRGVDSPAVSASQFRADPRKCLDLVIPPAREYFRKLFS